MQKRHPVARAIASLSIVLVCGLLVSACGDDGDDSSGSAVCQRACDKHINCPNDPAADCMAECESIRSACPSEFDAFANCGVSRPDSDFYCDEDGESDLNDGICEAEGDALGACLLG